VSDTPKTDELAKREFVTDGVWIRHARELERENAALRATAVEACALARVWVIVWGDKLSAESIQRLEQLEKQILKEAQP
jgi:hypothetical protein